MMKFLILACLVLSAVAEPEPQHETVGFTKHLMVLSFPSTPPASSNKRLSMALPTPPQLLIASSSLSTLMDFTIPSLMDLIIPLTEFIILARERPRPRLELMPVSSTLITMVPLLLLATPSLMATPITPCLATPTKKLGFILHE